MVKSCMLHPEGEGTALMFIQYKLPCFLGVLHIFITVFRKILKAHMHLRLKMNSDVCDALIGHDHKHMDSTVYFKGAKQVDENCLRLTTCVLLQLKCYIKKSCKTFYEIIINQNL